MTEAFGEMGEELETVYRSHKTVLVVLQDHTKELLENFQSNELWAMTHYAHRLASSSSTRDISQQPSTELGTYRDVSQNPRSIPSNTSYSANDVYFTYFYPGAMYRSQVVDTNAMENKWKFHPECYSASTTYLKGFVVDETPCSSRCLWLLASLALALEIHLMSEDATFAVLSEVFDKTLRAGSKPNSFTNGPLTPRLKSDINYWISFAKSRRMQFGISEGTFNYGSLKDNEKKELISFLVFLLSEINSPGSERDKWVVLRAESDLIRTILKSLTNVGLPFIINGSVFGYHYLR